MHLRIFLRLHVSSTSWPHIHPVIHPLSSAMFAAVLTFAGYLLLKLAVVSFTVALVRLNEGNAWAFLLVPVTAGSVSAALWTLRAAAAQIPRD